MAKEIYRRYIWLAETIRRSREGLTFEQINESWQHCSLNDTGAELSKRTFRNWVASLPTALGVWVECERKAPFRYYIDGSDAVRNDFMDWTLNAFSLGNMMYENRLLHDRILLEDIPSANEHLGIICTAMRKNRMIWMSYEPFGAAHGYSFETKPYALKLSRRRWYLIAHSDAHDREFTYGLDRIVEVRMLDRAFSMPKEFSAKRRFDGCIGIYADDGSPVQHVRLKVSGHVRDYIDTLPLHGSQEVEECTDDYTIYGLCLRENVELIDAIMALGTGCEVLEPLSLRHKVRQRAEEMARMNGYNYTCQF